MSDKSPREDGIEGNQGDNGWEFSKIDERYQSSFIPSRIH